MGPYSAIRQGDWKLIYFYGLQKAELYNLTNDIGEHHNLVTQYPDKAKALIDKLVMQLQAEHAQFPINANTGKTIIPQLNQ